MNKVVNKGYDSIKAFLDLFFKVILTSNTE